MKKNLSILFGVLLAVFLSAVVFAANEKAAGSTQAQAAPKNMTYGQCVSEHAVIKNNCYATVKGALAACREQAAQSETKKDATKQCSLTYKKDKKQCKTTFKAGKQECRKIKHNFLETLGSAFK